MLSGPNTTFKVLRDCWKGLQTCFSGLVQRSSARACLECNECFAAQLELLRAIGRAIAALHDGGIIHGDLTTSNLLVRSADSVLVSAVLPSTRIV